MKRTDMDNHSRYSRKWKNSLTAGILLALSLGGTACAMPTGGQIIDLGDVVFFCHVLPP